MRASLSVSTRLDPGAAAAEAVDRAMSPLGVGPPSAAIVVATAAWGESGVRTLVESIAAVLDCPALAGGTVDGLLVEGREIEHRPAVALLAVHGLDAEAHLCTELAGSEDRAGLEIGACLAEPGRSEDLVLVFADSLGVSASALLSGLGSELAPMRVAGIGASEPRGGSALVWAGDEISSGACAALVLRPRRAARLGVTSGMRSSSGPMRISRAQDNWILGLDGRPALDVLRAALPESLRGQREPRHLLVAVTPGAAGPERDHAGVGLVRNVVGFDERRRAVALAEPIIEGESLSLVTLDEAVARADLMRALDAVQSPDAAFGCYLSCRSRGRSLFAAEGVESGYLERAFGDLPMLGVMGAYQLGPAGRGAAAESHLHTYAGVLALVEG